jgi:hypothetical protein
MNGWMCMLHRFGSSQAGATICIYIHTLCTPLLQFALSVQSTANMSDSGSLPSREGSTHFSTHDHQANPHQSETAAQPLGPSLTSQQLAWPHASLGGSYNGTHGYGYEHVHPGTAWPPSIAPPLVWEFRRTARPDDPIHIPNISFVGVEGLRSFPRGPERHVPSSSSARPEAEVPLRGGPGRSRHQSRAHLTARGRHGAPSRAPVGSNRASAEEEQPSIWRRNNRMARRDQLTSNAGRRRAREGTQQTPAVSEQLGASVSSSAGNDGDDTSDNQATLLAAEEVSERAE